MADKPGLIGKAIRIKGELRGLEDLVIEGKVEGNIALRKHHLFVERSAVINANTQVDNITIKGELSGNTDAADKVEVTGTAKLVGDIKTPRLVIKSGARVRGSVDMAVELPEGLLDGSSDPVSLASKGKGKGKGNKQESESIVHETTDAPEATEASDEAWH